MGLILLGGRGVSAMPQPRAPAALATRGETEARASEQEQFFFIIFFYFFCLVSTSARPDTKISFPFPLFLPSFHSEKGFRCPVPPPSLLYVCFFFFQLNARFATPDTFLPWGGEIKPFLPPFGESGQALVLPPPLAEVFPN